VLRYTVTGFALCGELGFGRIVGQQTALSMHNLFE